MTNKIKICPFCGSDASSHEDNTGIILYFYVECDTCHARSSMKRTLNKAIDTWNMRYQCTDRGKL